MSAWPWLLLLVLESHQCLEGRGRILRKSHLMGDLPHEGDSGEAPTTTHGDKDGSLGASPCPAWRRGIVASLA